MKIRNIHANVNSRGLSHKNLIVHASGIDEFVGQDIPGVLRIVERKGAFWRCELATGAHYHRFVQDRQTGTYFPRSTWAEALERLDSRLAGRPARMGMTAETLEAVIRAIFPRSAFALDAAAHGIPHPKTAPESARGHIRAACIALDAFLRAKSVLQTALATATP